MFGTDGAGRERYGTMRTLVLHPLLGKVEVMSDERVNCWDHQRCEREPGGAKSHEVGVCPAVSETRLDGQNGGLNAGRACWVVAGTLCHGTPCHDLEEKFEQCAKCGFYRRVQREEGNDYVYHTSLLMRLKG